MSCTRARHQPKKHLPPLASTRSEGEPKACSPGVKWSPSSVADHPPCHAGDSIALDMGRPVLESQDQASIREASQSDTHTSLPLIALRDLATRCALGTASHAVASDYTILILTSTGKRLLVLVFGGCLHLCRSQDTITENVRTRWVGALRELREVRHMMEVLRGVC